MHEPDLDDLIPLDSPGESVDTSSNIRYRDYFRAIERVVIDHWSDIVGVVTEAAMPRPANTREVWIVGEKHGSDYHPARVAVVCSDRTYSFVMNVALTARGMARNRREFDVLRLLSARPGRRYVPKVYFFANQDVESVAGMPIASSMFLGEWLEDYHEFHLSLGPADGTYDTILWDGGKEPSILPPDIAWEVFRQTAFILTWYYDHTTFSEVYPWHHAAGDFVVRVKDGGVSVKLISVRQYEPRIVVPTSAAVDPLNATLAFFANLTLRNRLDRLHGVGEVVLAGQDCVEATVRGFFDALKAKATDELCSSELPDRFAGLAGALSPADWTEVFRDVVDSYDPRAPDVPVIMESLAEHIFQVYRLVRLVP